MRWERITGEADRIVGATLRGLCEAAKWKAPISQRFSGCHPSSSRSLKPPPQKISGEKKQRQGEDDSDQEAGVHAALRSFPLACGAHALLVEKDGLALLAAYCFHHGRPRSFRSRRPRWLRDGFRLWRRERFRLWRSRRDWWQYGSERLPRLRTFLTRQGCRFDAPGRDKIPDLFQAVRAVNFVVTIRDEVFHEKGRGLGGIMRFATAGPQCGDV